jgi:hypothetical protein
MVRNRRRLGYLFLLFAVAALLLGMKVRFGNSPARPVPAIPALLQAFNKYPVVALGEGHWSQQAGDFYLALARTPGFAERVNVVVLECANSLYQPVLDRYMNGEEVAPQELSQVWRNTTKVVSWDSPIYEHLIRGLHDVNLKLPASRRIRVLAGDAPIDWSRVKTRADWESALQGEDFFVSLIEREVLAKNQKALLIMGVNHVTHGGNWFGKDDVTSLLEKHKHPVYVALLWGVPGNTDPAVTAGPIPSLTELDGTKLGDAKISGRPVEDLADAYVYLGRSEQVAFPDWTALQSDKTYWAELQRRHQIQFGCALDVNRWNARGKPCP